MKCKKIILRIRAKEIIEILEQNVCRVIKIDKKALFEFVYENFVRNQKELRKIPTTTDAILSPEKIYKDYTFDELREMTKERN